MTAKGTLYIDEECRDAFEKELNGWFGEGMWQLNGNPFGDYWDLSEFPLIVEVNVVDMGMDEVIGKVEIKSEFYVSGEDGGERYVEIAPHSIKLLEVKDELGNLVRQKIEQIKNEKERR